MYCPYCEKEIHFEEYSNFSYILDREKEIGIGMTSTVCPACEELIFIFRKGHYIKNDYNPSIEEPTIEKIIYPFIQNQKKIDKAVPENLVEDYREALIVLPYSPKASAALSRRCLQNFLHNEININKGNLSREIEEFIKTQNCPSYLLEAVDAIRNIGNFAAHPLKDKNTGEIAPVESGEAEWLLDILEQLFDYYFVLPKKLEEKKFLLNKKLKALGKSEMK